MKISKTVHHHPEAVLSVKQCRSRSADAGFYISWRMTCSTPCQLKAVILSCPGCLVVTIQHKQLNQRAARRVLANVEASWSRGTVCHLPRTENEKPLWLHVSKNLVCYVLLTNKEDERTSGPAQPTGFTTRLNQLTLQVSRPLIMKAWQFYTVSSVEVFKTISFPTRALFVGQVAWTHWWPSSENILGWSKIHLGPIFM